MHLFEPGLPPDNPAATSPLTLAPHLSGALDSTNATDVGESGSEPLPARTMAMLAASIVRAIANAEGAARSALEYAREAGELLSEAKARMEHGGWLPWLAAHCPNVSPRSAQHYMKIAREWDRLASKYETDSHLPVREALALLRSKDDATPLKLAPGGTDAGWEDEPDVAADAITAPDSYARSVVLVFDGDRHAEFRRLLADLESALDTTGVSDTVFAAVRRAHEAVCAASEAEVVSC